VTSRTRPWTFSPARADLRRLIPAKKVTAFSTTHVLTGGVSVVRLVDRNINAHKSRDLSAV
jgi:hypothetical protein